MPLYEYKCEICGKEEEVFAHLNDPPPDCDGKPMTKLLSSFTIRKGGGLYSLDIPTVDDYVKSAKDWEPQ